MTLTQTIDVVDSLVPDLDPERRLRRPVTREQLQASYDALFTPVDDSHVSLVERDVVAAFATRLTAADVTAEHYAQRLTTSAPELAAAVLEEAAHATASGPFGLYREAGLQGENSEGLRYRPSSVISAVVGERLAAALEHVHLLVYRPREADDTAIAALLEAGWSTDAVVTLSQEVAFLAFQQRVVTGLRALANASTGVSA